MMPYETSYQINICDVGNLEAEHSTRITTLTCKLAI